MKGLGNLTSSGMRVRKQPEEIRVVEHRAAGLADGNAIGDQADPLVGFALFRH
jgi:hypothetical protein